MPSPESTTARVRLHPFARSPGHTTCNMAPSTNKSSRMKSMISKLTVTALTVSCMCVAAVFGADDGFAAAHSQDAGARANHGLSAQPTPTQADCPRPASFDAFKRQIAYMRTERPDPFAVLQDVHLDVWETRVTTVFYVHEQLSGFTPSARVVYVVADQGASAGYTCPATEEWKQCAVRAAGTSARLYVGRSCSVTLDLRTIPVWKPSSNDREERRISADLHKETAPPAFASANLEMLQQFRQKLVDKQPVQARSEGTGSEVKANPSQRLSLTPANCPNATALDQFRYQIAYQRAWGEDPYKGLSLVHVDVWMRGPLTGFYMRGQTNKYGGIREVDIFDERGPHSGGSCAPGQDWRRCIERFAAKEYFDESTSTCTTMLDLRTIPAWRPSPNDDMKRHVAVELRMQIEVNWPNVEQIKVRDFNLGDPSLMVWLKLPGGDVFQQCDFHAMRTPPCENWAGFGMEPERELRESILKRSYRIK